QSNYFAVPSVYTGSPGALSLVACNYSSQVSFTATANTTYYVMVAASFYGSTVYFGNLVLNVVGPPANDAFANATAISSLPFKDTVDASLTTTENGEPTPSCNFGGLGHTVWYSYTPAVTGSVSASSFSIGSTSLAAYTGSTLSRLTKVGCGNYGNLVTLRASAGQTYYFQTFGLYGSSWPITFNLKVTPPPQASFAYGPYDPSLFDRIQFYNTTYDPGQVGVQSETWSFGDGASATGCCPQ